jgi:ribonuclease HII
MVSRPRTIHERNLFTQGYETVIGVDEVGMACLAGPVVVCALAVQETFFARRHPELVGLRDSKLLQPHQRERFAAELMRQEGLRWRISLCDAPVVDEINIYQASRRAMRDALAALGPIEAAFVLVDGNKRISDMPLPQESIVGGDRKVWAIAAASIIAKVHRDSLMKEYALIYPGYGFEIHKGYPTRMHRQHLAKLGPCPIHRKSFSAKLP